MRFFSPNGRDSRRPGLRQRLRGSVARPEPGSDRLGEAGDVDENTVPGGDQEREFRCVGRGEA